MRRWLLPSLFLLPLCGMAQTQSKGVSLPDRLESLVNDRFEATRCPGLSVAVASHDQIVFSKALGKADIEQDVPLTTASVQRLASVSKPITGTIIMDLVEQGKLSLDDPVRQYLPELPTSYQGVTLRKLLSHQSGVRDDVDEEGVLFSIVHYPTSRDVLKVMMAYPLAFTPGTRVEYSSRAFTVLGAAAESVTGRSFQQLSMDFFSRHRMSGFALDDPYAIVPGRVHGYLVDRTLNLQFNDDRPAGRDYLKGTPGEITNAHCYDISNRYPAGGLRCISRRPPTFRDCGSLRHGSETRHSGRNVDAATHGRRDGHRIWAWLGSVEMEAEDEDGGHEWAGTLDRHIPSLPARFGCRCGRALQC